MSFTTPPPMPSAPPPQPPRRTWSTRNLVVAGAVVAVLAGGAVFAATRSGDSDVTEDEAGVTQEDQVDPQAVEFARCLRSWNENNTNRENVGSMETVGQTSSGRSAYVHVGNSATFPDLCMITVSNAANHYSQQYVEQSRNTWGFAPAWTGMASQLDTSVTAWNARMAPDGTITPT
ncbi:hypothetical protein AB0M10_15675 [Streptomyces sp. NPDC051840]|uniref:hypothetical protein n=1 Tax=Streptomyces sp. NPDC051840 TaxID=3154752 RepID=UPI003428631E